MDCSPSTSSNLQHTTSEDSEMECLEENVVIDELTVLEPTSVVLRFCKRKFLRPYVCILGLAGLRPSTTEVGCCSLLGHLQSIMVLALLVIGYVLQYLAGFRRDHGFQELDHLHAISHLSTASSTTRTDDADAGDSMKTMMLNTGKVMFIYVIPALLHFVGYVSAVYIYRFADHEKLQCLVERVFILCSIPRRLVATLWIYFLLGTLWLVGSTLYIGLQALDHSYVTSLKWMGELNPTTQCYVRGLLFVVLFFHDLTQMATIVSYSLLCYLLRCYLQGLKEKLLLHTIEPLNWMREICEFRKLLHHLNARISLPVACLTLLNLSYTFSSVVHLFRDVNACPIRVFNFTIANVLLWLVISLAPFIQAASLTVTCRQTQSCGHLISIRPFVHRNTKSEDLNTVLLYASSLQMSAKLFRMPISAHYLCFFTLVCLIGILTFGMCLTLSIGGD
ncbi:uncharacterized protein LOC129765355 isoform X2 [Toxorhynchites rutilus septentrionalis]|uniref:uncharacterized protein LOC129765355 isoform X2 n=1 Tax=Toxorhynchites rutilus septentrionalis TaxID=329112 RepID=UPI002479015B|nr:uncharacterized protein LOC129765355 isoform X2 [Toxorhynchites rutilus septentrionalis]